MLKQVVTQANKIAQDHGVSVFPASADKRPLIRNWPTEAAFEPEDIEKQFSMKGAELIGVPMKQNGLIAFDLDYGHTDDPERKAKLAEFEKALLGAYPGGVRVHRTRSGGKHLIMNHPTGKVPGYIMPKLDVRSNAYIVWEGPGYEVEVDVALDDLATPGGRFIEVWERAEGLSGEHLPTLEEADHILRSNGDDGQRHLALLKIAQEWVRISDPSTPPEEIAAGLERHLRTYYADAVEPARFEKLVEWRYDRQRQHWDGELGRALGKPIKGVQQLSKFAEIGRPLYEAAQARQQQEREAEVEADASDLFVTFDPSEDVSLKPWVIPYICREGDIGGFAGIPGLGKTNLTSLKIAALASGRGSVAGLPDLTRSYTVAWANPEEAQATLHLRLKAVCDELGVELEKRVMIAGYEQLANGGADFLIPKPGAAQQMVYDEAVVERWVRSLRRAGAEVLVIDPLTEFNSGNENDRGHRLQLMRGLRKVCSEVGMTLIYWAHTGKAPESKRNDWYDGDLYAERGSSGGIGTNAFGGTLTRLYPRGMKAADSHRWDTAATDPSSKIPNIIKLSVVKNKISPAKPTMYWEIRQSSKTYDGDTIPVCIPLTQTLAKLMVEQAQGALDASIQVDDAARALVEEFGAGEHHSLSDIHAAMRERNVEGWPQIDQLRLDREAGQELLKTWSDPRAALVGGVFYTVSMTYDPGGQKRERFTLRIEPAA